VTVPETSPGHTRDSNQLSSIQEELILTGHNDTHLYTYVYRPPASPSLCPLEATCMLTFMLILHLHAIIRPTSQHRVRSGPGPPPPPPPPPAPAVGFHYPAPTSYPSIWTHHGINLVDALSPNGYCSKLSIFVNYRSVALNVSYYFCVANSKSFIDSIDVTPQWLMLAFYTFMSPSKWLSRAIYHGGQKSGHDARGSHL